MPSPATAGGPDLVHILITHEGLSRLGCPEALMQQLDPAFRRGSRNLRTYEKLRDPMAALWEPSHRQPWHVVELHWRSDRNNTPIDVASSGPGHSVLIERGKAFGVDGKCQSLDDAPRYNHFGILDGSSNPVYSLVDYEKVLAGRAAPERPWRWDPRQKLSTLLAPDLLAERRDCYGSYFVFRKFRQDVDRFREKLATLASNIAAGIGARGGASWWWAQLPVFAEVGRDALQALSERLSSNRTLNEALSCPAGVALAQAIFGVGPNGERAMGGDGNDFNYEHDLDGRRCPYGAHARACNARGSRRAPQVERRAVIARRGISYDEGLLFWCAQASIGEQFEYMQEKWINGGNVDLDHRPTPGVDYLVGRPGAEDLHASNAAQSFSLDIRDTIELRASEYLFAPSLVGFEQLKRFGGVQ